jgi:hypothetical protein
MTVRKKSPKAIRRAEVPPVGSASTRGSRGKTREGASFPVAPSHFGLPRDYAENLKGSLPTVEEIEAELSREENEQ